MKNIKALQLLRKRPWVDLALVGLIAVGVRCYRLDVVPPGLDRDAAANGLYALDLLQRGIWPVFVLHMGVAQPLMIYLQSVSTALLGPSIVALRIVSALVGALTACTVYLLAWILWREEHRPWRRYGALISGLGLALCPVHVHVSRMGLRAILSPFLQVMVLVAFLHGWRTGRRWAFALAGVTLGLGMYSYLSFFVTLLLLPLGILVSFFMDRHKVRQRWPSLLSMVGCTLAMLVPVLPFWVRYPSAFLGRAGQVTLLQHPWMAERGWAYVLLSKLGAYIRMSGFSWQGQYNEMGYPLLDPVLLVTFLVGVGVAWARVRRPSSVLVLLGLPVMLLPDLFSDRLSPHVLRVLGVFPFVFLLVGLGGMAVGCWAVQRRPSLSKPVWAGMLVLVLISGSGVQLYRYVTSWAPQAQETDRTHYNLTGIAEAAYLVRSDRPVLIPLAEYERNALRYLIGSSFPVHLSALNDMGRMRGGLWGGDIVVLMPHDPDRMRLRGSTISHDPAQYALLRDGTAYLLPPLDRKGESMLAALMADAPCDLVLNANGQDVATAYHLANPKLSFVDPPTRGLSVRFGDQIELLGSTLSDWHLQPGGEVTVTLFWRALGAAKKDYRLFVHLLNRDEAVLYNADTTPGMGTYPTAFWRTDEWVSTFHRLSVPADLPPGKYQIEVGWFDRLNLDRLPVVGSRGEKGENRVLVGPLKVPLPASESVPVSEQPFRLGEAISLTGYELVGQAKGDWRARAGEALSIRLAWKADDRPAADYVYFVHLAAADETILAQRDAMPRDGAYSTSIWERGEVVVEHILLSVPSDAAPEAYRLWAGMYDPLDGQRVPAFGVMGRRLDEDRILLGQVRVLATGR